MEKADDSIAIDIVISAPIQKVWAAWTDPAIVLTWFGSDPRGKGLKATLDVRPGGSFEVTFQDSDQTEHTCSGVYSIVREFTTLAFSWTWKNEPGVESLVTVLLIPEGDWTRMKFEHAHLGSESKHNYLSGWKSTFNKLERALGA